MTVRIAVAGAGAFGVKHLEGLANIAGGFFSSLPTGGSMSAG